jgi:hypothetical protein
VNEVRPAVLDDEEVAELAARLASVLAGIAHRGGPHEPPASREDVLTITQAAQRLGMRREEARAWLLAHDLVRLVAGEERVIWGDVLDALRGTPDRPRTPVSGIPRAKLNKRRGT